MNPTDRILPGVALMIAFCILAPLIDVASKLAAQGVPVGVIVFGRGLVQAVLMLPVLLVMALPLRLPARDLPLVTFRAALLVGSTYCFVAAVRVMPIADALAIVFVEPFIILLIGKIAFSEEVGPRRLMACTVGFAGSLLVIQPSFAAFGPVALFPLGTAVCFAFYILVTRHLSRRQHPVAMQFHTALLAALLCLPLLAFGTAADLAPIRFDLPQGIFWLWCFCVGLAATVSHMAMTYALKLAPSSTLAPLHYLEIVTASLLGYVFFGDFPDTLTWTGIGIIVASGLYIIFRERRLARAERAPVTASALTPPAPQPPL
ncbi:MAG: DMT family transporter [Defluviimonas sp.]|uniref:DMT family transporter n=1 Tax=Albidovulum sp. TaxID=1872424 RepID=UPI001DDA192E|nr:DMT family transporter [Paracoccaceae bacterium]MCC0063698.1 DMT family transporter [Defluviimonas sp.]